MEEKIRENKINMLLKIVYDSNIETIISENDIDFINDYYKNNYSKVGSYDELMSNERFNSLLGKLHSAEYEIKKQFEVKKALQQGIISECNFSESLAKILGLNKVIDLDNVKYNEVPKEFNEFVQNTSQTFSGARYLFYNNKKKDIFIFQYGNPALGDAEIIFEGVKIRLEYKEKHAKLGEYDILYDDAGKLIPSDKIKNELNALKFLIDSFNQNTNIFSEIGHNYNAFDNNTCIMATYMYLKSKGVDLIISEVDNQLVAITFDCFKYVLPDKKFAVSLKGSEIRTAGRNSKKVWTNNHFEKVLSDLSVEVKNDDTCHMNKVAAKLIKGKGKDEITRLKLGNIYFVKVENIKEDEKEYIFKKSDVKQLVPSISMHMTINATKNQLKELLVK